MVRPWYYSVVTADPMDANTMYLMNLSTWKSTDGGHTFTRIRLPHGDTHALWIDPKDPKRMISGNDGGATVSLDGGAVWSSIMNQPTAQFYHTTTDDQWPYRIYGAQQDNTTVSIVSRSDNGVITPDDWYPVGGGESGYIAPKPGDPNIVIAGTYTGTMTRYDVRTKQAKDISVWLNNYDGWAARDIPNRFQWTFPIVFSKHDPKVLYVTANRVFRSLNEGNSWEAVSGDLTLHDPKTLGPAGGPITYDMTGTEWYATIFAFAESPLTPDVLWAGSDDGLVHVSRDRGKTWTNVTPPAMAKFTRVSIIDAVALRSPARRTSPPIDISSTISSRTSSRRPTTARRGRKSRRAFPTARTRAPFARIRCVADCSTPARRPASTTRPTTARIGRRCSSIFRARRCAT